MFETTFSQLCEVSEVNDTSIISTHLWYRKLKLRSHFGIEIGIGIDRYQFSSNRYRYRNQNPGIAQHCQPHFRFQFSLSERLELFYPVLFTDQWFRPIFEATIVNRACAGAAKRLSWIKDNQFVDFSSSVTLSNSFWTGIYQSCGLESTGNQWTLSKDFKIKSF